VSVHAPVDVDEVLNYSAIHIRRIEREERSNSARQQIKALKVLAEAHGHWKTLINLLVSETWVM
jgi:hypothetical protein